MVLPRFISVNRGDSPYPLSHNCPDFCLTLPYLSSKYWDMNQFPFRLLPVRIRLRIDLPFAENQCERTFVHLPQRVFISVSLLLPPKFTQRRAPPIVTSRLLCSPLALLLHPPKFLDSECGEVLGTQLWHVYFRGRTPREVRD